MCPTRQSKHYCSFGKLSNTSSLLHKAKVGNITSYTLRVQLQLKRVCRYSSVLHSTNIKLLLLNAPSPRDAKTAMSFTPLCEKKSQNKRVSRVHSQSATSDKKSSRKCYFGAWRLGETNMEGCQYVVERYSRISSCTWNLSLLCLYHITNAKNDQKTNSATLIHRKSDP